VADLVKDCMHVRDVFGEQGAFWLCWKVISTSVLTSVGRVMQTRLFRSPHTMTCTEDALLLPQLMKGIT